MHYTFYLGFPFVHKSQANCTNNRVTLRTHSRNKLKRNILMASSSFITMKYVMRIKTNFTRN